MSVVYENPSACCDICKGDFGNILYDVKTIYAGRWGNLCSRCFTPFGPPAFVGDGPVLGTGIGQRYELQPDGSWLKVEG